MLWVSIIYSFFFNCWVVFHCVDVLQVFIHSPGEGHLNFFQYVAITNKATVTFLRFFVLIKDFHFTWKNTSCGISRIYCKCIFNYKEHSNCFPEQLYHFVFSSILYESFICFASLLALGFILFKNFSHFNKHVDIYYCGLIWIFLIIMVVSIISMC